jgi:hypothetical protein
MLFSVGCLGVGLGLEAKRLPLRKRDPDKSHSGLDGRDCHRRDQSRMAEQIKRGIFETFPRSIKTATVTPFG